MTSVQNMEGSERSGYVRLVDVGRRLSKGFDNYRDQYGFVFLSLALLIYCSKSGPKLCLINKLSLEEPVLNVTLYQDSFFSIAPSNRYWYADVSGNELFITTGDSGTRLEIRDWGRSGVTGGSYAEILGEALCCESDCPPVTSSGDYVGIPTKYTLASKVVVMYTIFLLPDLEERARDCVFTTLTNVHSTRVQNLWDTVIEHFCTQLYVVLATAVAAIVLSVRDALKLRAQSSLRSQEPTQSPLHDQENQSQEMSKSQSTEIHVVGEPSTPPPQHTTDAGTSRLTSLPNDISSSTDSLVSAVSENGKIGSFRMVCPCNKLGASFGSSSSSEQHLTSDSSSDDDSDPFSIVQEESTTDVPPPRYAGYRTDAVYENHTVCTGMPRIPPEGSQFGV